MSFQHRRHYQQVLPLHLLYALLNEETGIINNLTNLVGIDLNQLNQNVDIELHKIPKVQVTGGGQLYSSSELLKILDKSINFQEKLIEEFSEETGIFKEEIKSIEPFCLVYDRSDKVYDICSKIYVSGLLNDQVKCRYNDEYEDIEIFSLKKDFRKILELQCVPTSRIILNNLSSEQFSAMQ
jgi:hypothetical protein